MVNLQEQPRQGAFYVWQLEPGRYELKIGPDANDDGMLDTIEKTETLELARMSRVPVPLPPRRLMVYELRQVEKLGAFYDRPDLAVSEEDIVVEGQEVKVTIHNIGSSPARNFVVALADKNGKLLAKRKVESLEAPLDLQPRTLDLRLPLKRKAAFVLLDPDSQIHEITEMNNRVPMPPGSATLKR